MAAQIPVSTTYRVEVSGWDLEENFFVEKTELEWSEEQGKKVYMRHPLRDGAVVFVRLIQPTCSGHTFPIAYQVEKVRSGSRGMWDVRLVQLHPRTGRTDTQA